MDREEEKVLVCTDKNVPSHDFSIEKLLLKSNESSQIRNNCSGRGMKRCEEVTQHVKCAPSNSFTQIMTFSSSSSSLEGAAASAGSIKGKKKSSLYSSSSTSEQVTTSKLYLSLFLSISTSINKLV